MGFDFSDDPAQDVGDPGDSWVDDIGDFFASIASDVADVVLPDLPDTEDVSMSASADLEGSAADLPNGGFYQSLPGIDSMVGSVLDQNAQLCSDIDEFGKETFGEQAWAEAGEVAAADPHGMLEGIESPSDMYARFHKEDAQANADFESWRWSQQVIDDSETLSYNTETLLRYGY